MKCRGEYLFLGLGRAIPTWRDLAKAWIAQAEANLGARLKSLCCAGSLRLLGGLGLANVVTPKRAQVANIEPAVSDDWISPGFFHRSAGMFRLVGSREAAHLTVGLRSGLDQSGLPVLAVNIEPAIGAANRAGADTLVVPLHFAVGEFGPNQFFSP